MEILTHLNELSTVHPRLLWDDIILATAAVLAERSGSPPFRLELTVEGVPFFDDSSLVILIDPDELSAEHVVRVRRTYEASRLVEMAAIAVTGLALFHACHLEMRDLALRGSGADYLVGEAPCLLEIGGRSRRSDFGVCWQQKWDNLCQREAGRFLLCVVEFETPAGRLAFRPSV